MLKTAVLSLDSEVGLLPRIALYWIISVWKVNLRFYLGLFVATEERHTENTEKRFFTMFSVRFLLWLAWCAAASNIGIRA